jgi:hypothetical protein
MAEACGPSTHLGRIAERAVRVLDALCPGRVRGRVKLIEARANDQRFASLPNSQRRLRPHEDTPPRYSRGAS